MDGAFGGAVGGDLQARLDEIAAATSIDFDGQTVNRYSDRTVRNLARRILNRSYGMNALRLCHLVRIAVSCRGPNGYMDILWPIDPIRHGLLRRLLPPHAADLREAGIINEADCVVLQYPDGSFELSHNAVSDLFALFEFSAAALGLEIWDELAVIVGQPGSTKATVAEASNRLQSRLFAWLKPFLPPVQAQRKRRFLDRVLKEENGGDFGPEHLTDAVILTFWLRYSGDRELYFRLYRTVYAAFRRLRLDMQDDAFAAEIRRAASSLSAGGTEMDDGTIDMAGLVHRRPAEAALPDEDRGYGGDFEVFIGTLDEDEVATGPIERLENDDIRRVKFLTKADRDLVRELVADPHAVLETPLSTLRLESFGRGQNLLGSRGGLSTARLEKATERTFEHVLADFKVVRERLGAVIEASLHVLAQSESVEADENDGVVSPDFATLSRARKSFGRFDREGFRRSDLNDPEMLETHRRAAGDLHRIAETLDRIIATWTHLLETSGDDVFERDRSIFSRQFHILYGADK